MVYYRQEEMLQMFNKQLKQNIKAIDVEISKLNEELKELEYDSRYDVKKRTLEDLMTLRDGLIKNRKDDEPSASIIELDEQILELAIELSNLEVDETYLAKMKRLDELTKIRKDLSECKVKESKLSAILPGVISGGVAISAILIILKYEEENVITSKAFSLATSLFRRG